MTIMDMAIRKAKQSKCRYKISAIGLNYKGEVVGSAVNKPRFDRQHGGLHAETNLIRRYGSRLKTIIICRVGDAGDLLAIDPCKNCQKVADKMGIKIVSIQKEEAAV
jgi:tRNA(Arg) A34 adenosine deaminase TadA